MIQFTKWVVILMMNYLVISLLYYLFPPKDILIYSMNLFIDVLVFVPIWTFIHWNIKSDEELGIKPGIELF